MKRINQNEGIKKTLRIYSVPEEVINMIEEDSNVKVQTVAEFYVIQIMKAENEKKKIRKEQSPAEFMETLNKHRIIDK